MSARRLFLDRGIGETRGVVTLDGRPERLIVRRDGDDARLILGAKVTARVASLEPALATAFLDLGGGAEAILPFKPDHRPVRGETLQVEIRSEPRTGKLAIARALGPGEGRLGLIGEPQDVAQELAALGHDLEIIQGGQARRVADLAQDEALEVLHGIPGGGVLAVEPTRALTAIDIDLGERKGADAKRVTRQANLAALGLAARLLRLKSLGGIVVIDLVGRGHDGAALMAEARRAFGPDNPGVAIGPVGRFGTMELALPRRGRPLFEVLCGEDGRPSDLTLALGLIRRLQAEAQMQGGARLVARAHPAILRAAQPFVAALESQVGARFVLQQDLVASREKLDVGTV